MSNYFRILIGLFCVLSLPALTNAAENGPGLTDTLDWLGSKLIDDNLIRGYEYSNCGIAIDNYFRNSIQKSQDGYDFSQKHKDQLREISFSSFTYSYIGSTSTRAGEDVERLDFDYINLADAFYIDLAHVTGISIDKVSLTEPLIYFFRADEITTISLHVGNDSYTVGTEILSGEKVLSQRILLLDNSPRYRIGTTLSQGNPKIWLRQSHELAPRIKAALENAVSICRNFEEEELF